MALFGDLKVAVLFDPVVLFVMLRVIVSAAGVALALTLGLLIIEVVGLGAVRGAMVGRLDLKIVVRLRIFVGLRVIPELKVIASILEEKCFSGRGSCQPPG